MLVAGQTLDVIPKVQDRATGIVPTHNGLKLTGLVGDVILKTSFDTCFTNRRKLIKFSTNKTQVLLDPSSPVPLTSCR